MILYRWRVLTYWLYKKKLNWINRRRAKLGQLPVADSRGYPWKPLKLKDAPTPVGFPKPTGKLFYIDTKPKRDDN